jgi:hypothetical protein
MSTDHYVCFACRKAFSKRRTLVKTVAEKPRHPCPECGGPLSFTGPKYQPPERDAVDAWALDHALFELGQLGRSPRYPHGYPASEKVHTLRELRALRLQRKR